MDTGANVGGDGGPRLQMLPELVGRWRRRFYEEGRRGFFWPGTISVTTDRRLQVARVLIAMSNEGPVSRGPVVVIDEPDQLKLLAHSFDE